ncbi:MAG: hypothetical protein JWM19_2599, partial [Actinomycetia bacterium]|nr:hypothetical protein [Actinomycetes bacterium]
MVNVKLVEGIKQVTLSLTAARLLSPLNLTGEQLCGGNETPQRDSLKYPARFLMKPPNLILVTRPSGIVVKVTGELDPMAKFRRSHAR